MDVQQYKVGVVGPDDMGQIKDNAEKAMNELGGSGYRIAFIEQISGQLMIVGEKIEHRFPGE